MKSLVKIIPKIESLTNAFLSRTKKHATTFSGSKNYWESRYQEGGNSGAGSYNNLALFKAEVLNDFVIKNFIETVIEFGCGDGNQLTLSNYKSYLGFDVSSKAIEVCEDLFKNDNSRNFALLEEYEGEKAQLALSLDIIYHLVEDAVFARYMETLFDSSTRFVIIYSSNSDGKKYPTSNHVKHREFTLWIKEHRPQWHLVRHLENRYPYIENENANSSFSDFYIFSLLNPDTQSK